MNDYAKFIDVPLGGWFSLADSFWRYERIATQRDGKNCRCLETDARYRMPHHEPVRIETKRLRVTHAA
jgi:hypothetical protein